MMSRYKEGEYPHYEGYLKKLHRLSPILNPGRAYTGHEDVRSLGHSGLGHIREVAQQKSDLYKERLGFIKRDHAFQKQAAFNSGNQWIENRSDQDLRLELEVKFDICEDELKAIATRIKAVESTENFIKEFDRPLLPNGPRADRKINPNTGMGHIDGQLVKVNDKGFPAIEDERSRYTGLTVIDYIQKVAKPWLKANRKKYLELVVEWEANGTREGDRQSPRKVQTPWPSINGKPKRKHKNHIEKK